MSAFLKRDRGLEPVIPLDAVVVLPTTAARPDRASRGLSLPNKNQGYLVMRKIVAATALLCAFSFASDAEARTHHHHHRSHGSHTYGYSGRPAAWCGWYMRTQVGSDPGPQYNLARAWARYGSDAGGPRVGAIVVWPHHVGKIVGHENGQWIVQSGNDGHGVRTRPRSLAGAIAFRNA
jgi:hypothetical protein